MDQLRPHGMPGIGRIARAFDDVVDVIAKDVRNSVLLHFRVANQAPARLVTEAVCEAKDLRRA